MYLYITHMLQKTGILKSLYSTLVSTNLIPLFILIYVNKVLSLYVYQCYQEQQKNLILLNAN